jgi:hypothetical protein
VEASWRESLQCKMLCNLSLASIGSSGFFEKVKAGLIMILVNNKYNMMGGKNERAIM